MGFGLIPMVWYLFMSNFYFSKYIDGRIYTRMHAHFYKDKKKFNLSETHVFFIEKKMDIPKSSWGDLDGQDIALPHLKYY